MNVKGKTILCCFIITKVKKEILLSSRVFLFYNLNGHIHSFNTNAANWSKNIVMFASKKERKKKINFVYSVNGCADDRSARANSASEGKKAVPTPPCQRAADLRSHRSIKSNQNPAVTNNDYVSCLPVCSETFSLTRFIGPISQTKALIFKKKKPKKTPTLVIAATANHSKSTVQQLKIQKIHVTLVYFPILVSHFNCLPTALFNPFTLFCF